MASPDQPVGRHELDLRSARGEIVGGADAALQARLVIDQHIAARRRLACRIFQLETASSAPGHAGARGVPPVAMTTISGDSADTASALAVRSSRTSTPSRRQLPLEPARDPGEVLPPGDRPGKIDLPAQARRRLEQHDRMAALGGDPGRLQPAGPAADDHDAPCLRRAGDDVGHDLFPAGRRVLDAGERRRP